MAPPGLTLLLCLPGLAAWTLNPAVLEQHGLGNTVEEVELLEWTDEAAPSNSKPVEVMVSEAGYPVETHVVATVDGYLLQVHRVPGGRAGGRGGRPVFLQHGLLSSSADWVVTGPRHALAFLLADRGYDVWMGNFRGNTYSTNHIDPAPTPDQFWDFSWDEMAERDLPAMLLHMMAVTGTDRFHYIGHSMGTLTYYTACNYHPWIANATKLMVGYGAHTAVPHITSPLFSLLSRYMDNLEWVMEVLGVHRFLPANWLVQWLASEVCDVHMVTAAVCRNILFLIAGYNQAEMNNTMLPVIMGHTPAGTSTLTVLHYGQSVHTGEWAGLDRGSPAANLARWNSTSPPRYSYAPLTAPVALWWGAADWLVVPRDEAALAASLPNLVSNTRVPEAAFTHLDFIWGMGSREMVYLPTLALMEQFP